MPVILLAAQSLLAGQWRSLEEDGLHEADNPALGVLQNPGDALSRLPADSAGNQVDWVRALQDAYIQPRSSLHGQAEVELLDSDIIMSNTGSLPGVRFPHKPHTQWLDCGNCHEQVFKSKAGSSGVTMGRILEGEFCGLCHGAVAFPLTECNRCHTVNQAGPNDETSRW